MASRKIQEEEVSPKEENIAVEDGTTQTPGVNGVAISTAEKFFTQAELNTIIQQRVQQVRSKYADYEALQTEVATLKQERQAEAEKIANLVKENDSLGDSNKKISVEAVIAKAASKMKIDAEAAYRLADLSKLEVDEKGQPTNAAELVKEVLEKYPGLAGRVMPSVNAVNPATSVTSVMPELVERRQRLEYFGKGAPSVWLGGGVQMPFDVQD